MKSEWHVGNEIYFRRNTRERHYTSKGEVEKSVVTRVTPKFIYFKVRDKEVRVSPEKGWVLSEGMFEIDIRDQSDLSRRHRNKGARSQTFLIAGGFPLYMS